ncbi:ribonuclease domain-containing protein [Lysobacter cavernae]|uniref:Ribonuclease domain-containing protein n=1 Tax=Lysobacter cavernae TaxID=1685901 RepID=A0ABV7RT40_9GAMM
MRRPVWLIAAIVLLGLWAWSQRTDRNAVPSPPPAPSEAVAVRDGAARVPAPAEQARYPAFLPREAHDVLARIARGGPYAYRQDGGVFQNRERRLPRQPRGYYREYTVDTPGSDDRGARRLITGGGIAGESPPVEYWYSDDHYRSFRRFAWPTGDAPP